MARIIYFRKKNADSPAVVSPFEQDPMKMISGECDLIAQGSDSTIQVMEIGSLKGVAHALINLVNSGNFLLDSSVVYGLHTQRSFRQIVDWIGRFLPPEFSILPQQLLAFNADLVECVYNQSTLSLAERIQFNIPTVQNLLHLDPTSDDSVAHEVFCLTELAEHYG